MAKDTYRYKRKSSRRSGCLHSKGTLEVGEEATVAKQGCGSTGANVEAEEVKHANANTG